MEMHTSTSDGNSSLRVAGLVEGILQGSMRVGARVVAPRKNYCLLQKCYTSPDLAHMTASEHRWAGMRSNPSWITEESRRRGSPQLMNDVVKAGNDDDNDKKEYFALIALLKACAKEKDLYTGIRLHADIQKKRLFLKYPYLGSSLINLYARCGMIERAQNVLEELHVRDTVSWSSLINGYIQRGRVYEALNTLEQMRCEGLSLNAFTFASILKACGNIGDSCKGRQIHQEIVVAGLLEKDIVLGTALIDMYAKCGLPAEAREVLEELPVRNVFSWSALISGYCLQEQANNALNCFYQMQIEGLSPNPITFVSILGACGSTGLVNVGEQIHEEFVCTGLLEKHIALGNALVDMYVKCGMLARSLEVLKFLPVRNAISWNSLLAGCAQQGHSDEANFLFRQMLNEGVSPDAATFTCILNVCGSTGDVDQGIQIHGKIVDRSLLLKDIVLGNALVDMYAKCGRLITASRVLKELPNRDVISWNALISGYVRHEQCLDALNSFEQMQAEGISPNAVTFICILKSCSSYGAIDKGNQIHEDIISRGLLEGNMVLGTALVDLYAKCGALRKAEQVLEELPIRNVVSWSALMAGYAQHSQGHEALVCFERMQREGLCPNEVVFLCALNACGHSGLFNEAQILLRDMADKYGIAPNSEHCIGLMVVFGCVGRFDKLTSMAKVMPSSDCPVAILDACRKWGNSMLASLTFNHTILLNRD